MHCPICDVPANGICLFGRKDMPVCEAHIKALDNDPPWWVEA
jgi:hypothetical protein